MYITIYIRRFTSMRSAIHTRTLLLFLMIAQLSVIMSCQDDGIDIPNTPLSGTINGEEWVFSFARMQPYGVSPTNPNVYKYSFYFFSSLEINGGSCGGGNSTKPHLQVVLPLQVGSYPVSFGNENLKFVYGNGTTIDATSGSVEILAFDAGRMAGYIQAIESEDNMVEGRFIAQLCL